MMVFMHSLRDDCEDYFQKAYIMPVVWISAKEIC